MPISVIVPAHDEERVIERCLRALVADAREGELEVLVVCNGCRDRTADVARAVGGPVRVLETQVASKVFALNLGDAEARFFPRVYVDADVVLRTDALRRLASALESGPHLAAAPEMDLDDSRASPAVRAYYAVWRSLPYTREGMMGVGVYALSEAGRRRFEQFPDVIADDGYVRMLFAGRERTKVEGAPSRVTPPSTLSDLVRIKTRSRLGAAELARRFPELARRERAEKDYGGALATVLGRPRLWAAAPVYAWVTLATRLRARRQLRDRAAYVWERDESSRGAPT